MIIQSCVFSKLFYCCTVWSATSHKNISKLQSVQNFAARIVTGTRKYDHITPVLKQLNLWLPVEMILHLRVALTWHYGGKFIQDGGIIYALR